MGMNMLFAPWINENGVEATVQRIYDIIGDNPVYLTLILIALTLRLLLVQAHLSLED